MITARNLTKRYGDVLAVDQVNLDIAKGEVVGLLGQNGAGKTTIMKIVTGFIEPTEGTVSVGGLDVLDDRLGVQRLIGYLPENAPLYPEMLVQEYLFTMAELRGIAPAQRLAAVREAAEATGLLKHLVRPIGELSKGFRQRVGLAQAILHHPEVLILDEPTNGLDPLQIESIRKLILELAKRCTVIISTHILQEVEAVCDRVLVLINGRLVADGPIAAMLASSSVRLSLQEGTLDVAEILSRVFGVTQCRLRGTEDGHDIWIVDYEGPEAPTPDLIRAGVAAGWNIDAITPERFSLQNVFQRLQAEQARKLENAP